MGREGNAKLIKVDISLSKIVHEVTFVLVGVPVLPRKGANQHVDEDHADGEEVNFKVVAGID